MIIRRFIPLMVALLIILTLLPFTPAQLYASSPIGRIAYTYNGSIYVMNSDGTNKTLVKSSADYPCWSPDGTKIAFNDDSSGHRLKIMNPDGTNVITLANGGYGPKWSQDGTQILFIKNSMLSVINADGTNERSLNVYASVVGGYASGGTKIVYSYGSNIYVMTADGANSTSIYSNSSISYPTVSPDGTKVAFYCYSYLYIMNVDGSNVIGGIRAESSSSWSPDGQNIVYNNSNGLSFISATGTNGTSIANTSYSFYYPSWGLGDWMAPSVSTLNVSDITTSSVTLKGGLASLASAPAVNVSFQWGIVSGNYTNETTPQQLLTTGDFSFTLNNLYPGSTYYFRTQAVGYGTTYGIERSFTTSAIPVIKTVVTASNIGVNTAKLSGTLQALGSNTAVNSSFDYGLTTEYGNTTSVTELTATGGYNTTITGLAPGTTYHFRAKAAGNVTVCGDDSSFTTLYNFGVTTVPAMVTGLQTVTLKGNLISLGAETNVNVNFEYWPTAGGDHLFTIPVAKTAAGAFSANITGITAGVSYTYKAVAVGANTIYGAEMTFTTSTMEAVRSLPVVVTRGQQFNVTVTFTAPANNFNAIGLSDLAPTGWTVTALNNLSTPNTNDLLVTGTKADLIWYGPYYQGNLFTAVYKVTVPSNIAYGTYNFTNGTILYFVGNTAVTVPVVGVSQIQVVQGAIINGTSYEANGLSLGGVTETIDGQVSMISGPDGVYTLLTTTMGSHTIVATKTVYRSQTQTINVTDLSGVYTLNFKGEFSLVPNAPNMNYVLAGINKWKIPPQDGTDLSMSKVLNIISAWKSPIN